MLLGRRGELERLAGLLERARRGPSSALVVHGEPGVGKSSLLAFAAEQADGFTLLRVQPLEVETELPFAGLADLVRPIVGLLERLPRPQRAALEGALALGPPVPGDRFAVAAATLSLLAAAGDESPVLAIVDDAQWLDQPSRDTLLFAARRLGSEGVVLLFATRDREWLSAARLEALELRGLPPDDAAALVDSTGMTVETTVREWLVNQTGGNPLAILEAISSLSDAERRGAVPAARPPAVGQALERAFAAELTGLPEETRRALLIAATSETGSAAEIVLALTAAGLDVAALERAEREGVVVVSGGRVEFRHPLVRSAAYHVHDLLERRAAHRALAGALEGERAAWHLAAATAQPDERVAALLETAGESAAARNAYAAAARAFQSAAELSLRDEDKVRRTLGAGRALWLSGDGAGAAALLEDVVDLATDSAMRADLQHLRGNATFFTRPVPETYALLVEEAERVMTVDGARAGAMLTTAALASFMAGETRRAEETSRRALEAAAAVGGPAFLFARLSHGLALCNLGHVADAEVAMEPVLRERELIETIGEHTVALAGIWQSFVWLERWDEARGTLETIVNSARAIGAASVLPFPLAVLADLDLRQGRLAASYAAAAESVQLASETGQAVEGTYSLVTLARVEAVLGHEDDCRAHVREALALSRRSGAHSIEDYSGAALGLLELSLGRADRAVPHLAESEAFEAARGVGLPTVVPSAADLVEAYTRSGELEAAKASLAAFEERAERTRVRSALGSVARCRGMLAGETSYEAEFAQALELHDHETAFERARTQLCLGMRRRRSRRRADARAVLREALAYFDAAGAAPWADQARAELRAAGEATLPEMDGSVQALTPQELQVALVVAKGATNKEAAASLFLSPKTIEFHLGNAYRKLGIRSRSELVRRVEGLS